MCINKRNRDLDGNFVFSTYLGHMKEVPRAIASGNPLEVMDRCEAVDIEYETSTESGQCIISRVEAGEQIYFIN